MHSGRANPQQPAPVLIGSGSQSAHGQPSATKNTKAPRGLFVFLDRVVE